MAKNDSQTKTSSITSTPTNPQWVTDTTQGLAGTAANLNGQDPKSFFAGPSSLQNTQFSLADMLGHQGAGNLQQAAQLAGGNNQALYGGYNPNNQQQVATVAPGTSALGGIASYLNPYQQQVTDSTLNDLNRAREMAINGDGQGAIMSGQYGGSRQGVAEAGTNDAFLRNAASTLGNLNLQGFNTAAGLSNQDADRAQQSNLLQAQIQQGANSANQAADNNAWQFNAGVYNQGNQFNANQNLNSAGLLAQIGQYGLSNLGASGTTQQALNQQQAGAPLSVLQSLSGSYGGLPTNLFSGTQQNGTTTDTTQSGDLTKIGNGLKIGSQVAGTLAQIFSDVRLKRDVAPAGRDAKGRAWYDFRYLWDSPDEPKRRGVMAQDIALSDPHAVSRHASGYLMVDYALLGA